MKEAYAQAEQFLNDIFRTAGFDLRAQASEEADGCILNIDGADSPVVRSEGGELLFGDVNNFPSIGKTGLGGRAHPAADRFPSTGFPFFLAQRAAAERRVI